MGYIVNAVVVVALYTIALFPNLYIKLSRILVQVLTKLRILKNPEKTLDSWTLQVTSFTREIKVLAKDKKSIFLCVCINIVRLSLYYSLPFGCASLAYST